MSSGAGSVRVWSPTVRIVHWALVVVFVSNRFLNEEGETLHRWMGYSACALVALRLATGVRKDLEPWPAIADCPGHLLRYLRGREPRPLRHAPLPALGMGAMLVCILLLGVSGFAMGTDRFWGVEWAQSAHSLIAQALTALVVIHLIGVVRASLLHRENLVAAMFHGRKRL